MDLGIAGRRPVIFLVWFLNLYNFMDGIDGIAGVEAISVHDFRDASALRQRGGPSTALALLVVAAAAAGFLIWIWPPARIFMGDSGSGFLGFFVGSIAWATIVAAGFHLGWLILLGAFIVDATVTLCGDGSRRPSRRGAPQPRLPAPEQKVRQSSQGDPGHPALNVLWLDPLAYLAAARPALGAAFAIAGVGASDRRRLDLRSRYRGG